jgi:GT2 family glycosyltransferase
MQGNHREAGVTVVVPTWNAAAMMEKSLPCLVHQVGVRYEILVVDNGVVNGETEDVCRRFREGFPELHYLGFPKQLGYAGAVNAGVRAARYELVAVCNNDNLPEPGWLQALLNDYRKSGNPGAVVSSLVARPDFPDPLGARLNLWGRIVRDARPGPYIPFHPDGSAFLFSRAAYPRPYDEDYFLYHEDVSLGWRAWLTGGEVLLAEDSRASTFDGGSTRRIAYLSAFYTERNRWLNYLLFLSGSSLFFLIPLLKADALVKLVFGSNRRAKAAAWIWIIGHPRSVLRKRAALQAQRKRADRDFLGLLSFHYADGIPGVLVNWFFRGYARLLGFRSPAARSD